MIVRSSWLNNKGYSRILSTLLLRHHSIILLQYRISISLESNHTSVHNWFVTDASRKESTYQRILCRVIGRHKLRNHIIYSLRRMAVKSVSKISTTFSAFFSRSRLVLVLLLFHVNSSQRTRWWSLHWRAAA